jgi:hypothetical protein
MRTWSKITSIGSLNCCLDSVGKYVILRYKLLHRSFSIKAMMDIERFQHQKVVDLKETLAAYCVLQFKLARKVDKFNDSSLIASLFLDYIVRLHCFLLLAGSPSLATHQGLSREYTIKNVIPFRGVDCHRTIIPHFFVQHTFLHL